MLAMCAETRQGVHNRISLLPWFFFLCALFLRVFRLDRMSFWIDEAWTAYHVSLPIRDVYQSTVFFANPPLFHYLVRPFYLLFGRDDFWLRFPSAVFGAAAAPAAYIVLNRLLGRRAALAGAVFLTVSPFHLWYSQEFRMYSLLALEGLLALYFWVRAKETDSPGAWTGYALAAAAALYTHYWSLAFLAVQAAWVAVERLAGRRSLRWPLYVSLALVLAYLPWVPGMIRQTHEFTHSFLTPPAPGDIGKAFQAFLFGLGSPFGTWAVPQAPAPFWPWLYVLPLLLPALGAFWPGPERKRFAAVYLAGLLLPLLLVYAYSVRVMPIFVADRYTMMFFPAFVLTTARLAEVRGRWARAALGALAGAWLLMAGAALRGQYGTFDKSPAKALWTAVAGQPGRFKVCNQYLSEVQRFPFNYYAQKELKKLWEIDRFPPPRGQRLSRHDLVVPVPRRDADGFLAGLPPEWSLRARTEAAGFVIFRLSAGPE